MISQEHYRHFSEAAVKSVTPVSGGSINEAFQLSLGDDQRLFLKKNSAAEFPLMFEKEAKGLDLLRTGTSMIPETIAVWEENSEQFLLLTWIQPGSASAQHWEKAGKELANIHRTSNSSYGLGHSNFMGSLPQANALTQSFSEFFINSRLDAQLKISRDNKLLDASALKKFERFYRRIDEIVPQENPALVHGDLWTGNLLQSLDGIYFIDPAVAFSHREVDIAMTTLFGKPPESFYNGYNCNFKLQKGWEDRCRFFNLYPLLVHLNLFGVSYQQQILNTINIF